MLLLLQLVSQAVEMFSNVWNQGVYNYFNEIHTDFLKGKVLVKDFRSENVKYIKFVKVNEKLEDLIEDLKIEEINLNKSNYDYEKTTKEMLDKIFIQDIELEGLKSFRESQFLADDRLEEKKEKLLRNILKKKIFISEIDEFVEKTRKLVVNQRIEFEKLEKEKIHMLECIKKGTK